jgi:biopolymer transport protein ExbB
MKYFSLYLRFFLCLLILLFLDVSAFAEDVRNIAMQAEKMREKVLEKARLEEEMAGKEGDESLKKIFSDKEVLTQAILQIKRENRATKKDNDDLEKENKRLVRLEEELAGQFSGMDAMARELTGFARIAAKDIDALLRQSLQSDMVFGRVEKIAPILNKSRFPGMDDIRTMVDILFEEMKKSGEVRIENGLMINRAGEEITSKILTMGNFTAAYQLPDEMGEETGFLVNSDKSGCLFALSRLPPSSVAKGLRRYMGGESDEAPIDISRGAALRLLTHRVSLKEQIQNGGPIVWPILGIGIAALLIIIERFIFLRKVNINADKMMNRVNELADQQKWDDCVNLCEKQKTRPVPKVLLAGINARILSREDMENVLQETILREIPRLEKFLSTLGMLAAIAPLLGLLGTVTGMINTFHIITFYGTGDPKMMSGGISEALTTTMLGLGVAIPIMLFHTFLSRNVENIISQMEEKGVALANIVFKERSAF